MRRAWALVFCAACAPAPIAPPEVPAIVASAPAPPPEEPPPPPPPREVIEAALEGDAIAFAARVTRLSRDLAGAFGSTDPRPVYRGFARELFVQMSTDRGGAFHTVEASAARTNTIAVAPEKEEPCKEVLAPFTTLRGWSGAVTIVRALDHDQVVVGPPEHPVVARLPRGAAHGGCLDPDRRRVWLSWSTPTTPPELFSVGLRDGSIRPLRDDRRPALGELGAATGEAIDLDGVPAAVITEGKEHRGVVLLVDGVANDVPLASWSSDARVLAAAGFVTVRVHAHDDAAIERALAAARERFHGPVAIVDATATVALAAPTKIAWVIAEGASLPERTPPRTLPVVIGEDAREGAIAAARAGDDDASYALVTAPTPRLRRAAAWGRAAAWVLAK